jgi:hypothetical protein
MRSCRAVLCLVFVFFLVGLSSRATQTHASALDHRIRDDLVQMDFDRQFDPPSKTEWPELKGKSGEEAKAAILAEFPDLKVHLVPKGAMVTMDMRMDRVRLFVSKDGTVVATPKVG